ncbi:aarF domain-containing protein kinase 1 isoform X2 [Tripterygium wilfordii]|uniref:aarF domain-containing protein kinase 1 isoform X2 n=1 Tax=Tripterygium wilfordii TaxID=458696 RepID=UPI0018F84F1F|nr:aarF domain-containing protein kinase 1 isoform X2 [Tripterygium wilfordii]
MRTQTMPSLDLKDLQEKLSIQFRPLQRSFEFWLRTADIYAGYKAFQVRVSFEKDVLKREAMWERQHEFAADKIYAMCSDMGGFFLKVAQIIGKPDLAPAAWVRRLVTLCDQAPATPFGGIQLVLKEELGQNLNNMFERFDVQPLGSASIAQIGYEFDFVREANAMERIQHFLYENNKKSPVLVPRVLKNLATRRVLVMEYIDGTPILKLGDEIAKRGINPDSKIAVTAKRNILQSLTLAYGQMILKSGFFHADPHPGNILICKGSEVALLDYGQVKDLPDNLRLAYANLIVSLADKNPMRVSESIRELGIGTFSKCQNEQQEMFKLAETLFDTKLPPGVTTLQPFAEDSSIKKIAVLAFPEELFSVLRTVHLLRGLSVGMGINYSCAEQWRPIAEEALYHAGRLKDVEFKSKVRKRRFFRRLLPRG